MQENIKSQQELFARIKELEEEVKRLKSRKKYGLVWEDKPEDVVLQCERQIPVLKEIKNRKIVTDNTRPTNLLIEGDNYHALSVLNYTHKGKIDVIYIDPPYNTGNKDFKYNDDYVDKEDGFRHSKWLSFISKRLHLAKNLLSEDGIIFISIGDDEQAQLKILCDEVFGYQNFITKFTWEKTQHFGRQKLNYYSNADYVLSYAKKLNNGCLKELFVEYIKTEHGDAPLYNDSNPEKVLYFPAGKVKFNIKDGEYTKTTDSKYILLNKVVVKNGINKNGFSLKFRSRWAQGNTDKEISKGTTFWVKSENFAIRAIYGDGKTSHESPKQILFSNSNNEFVSRSRFGSKVGTSEEATSELENILGEQLIFDYPKPVSLLKYLISSVFDFNQGDFKKNLTILDFFSGSGTTGHAVMELNKEDGGNRQFILCTNNENNICEEVTYERLKRVIKGYKNKKGEKVEGLGGNLEYLKCEYIDKTRHSDNMKMRLMRACSEMLCLKENSFTLEKEEKDDETVMYRIYGGVRVTGSGTTQTQYVGIYYDLDDSYLDDMRAELKKYGDSHKTAYIFSLRNVADYIDDYRKWRGIDIEEVPQKILEIYETIYKRSSRN